MPDLLLSGGYYLAATIKRETLGRLIDTALRISDRVTMVTDIDGIVIQGVDPACIAMLEISLPKEAFETFEGVFAHIDVDIMAISNLLDVMDGDVLTFEIDIYTGYLSNQKETQEFSARQFEPKEFPEPVTYDGMGMFCREWLMNILGTMDADTVWIGISSKREFCIQGEDSGLKVSYRLGAMAESDLQIPINVI